ncbi:hypothetical protein J437_LFUL019514 [Ladona fulva]|nr:hypothetical protein J437_LFUL019514 [Ladona fulva]
MNLNNPQELEEAIQHCSFVLHPNHSLITNLKVSLVQIYGNTVKFPLKDCLPLMLEHKVKLCQDILKVADIIEPGLSRLRGTIIYEMCEPLEMLEKYKLSNGLESYGNYCKNLMIVAKCLEEAVSMLSLEAPDSPEAEMCLKAKAKLYNVQKIINDNLTQPDVSTENKKLTSSLEVFEDYKLSLSSNKNKLIDSKDKDQKMLSEFVKEIQAANIQTSTTSSDLTDIIEILKEEGQEDSFGDLQIFEEMMKSLIITKEQNSESCAKIEDKKFL